MREIKLQDLKAKTPAELVSFAEELGVENASTMRKQELMFAILKQLAIAETDIIGEGVVEVLSDGFGFLRSWDANYLPGPDDIYISPSQVRRFGLRRGMVVKGANRLWCAHTARSCLSSMKHFGSMRALNGSTQWAWLRPNCWSFITSVATSSPPNVTTSRSNRGWTQPLIAA